MAYQVISQNNTTTTLADENGNVIRVPARVSLATSTDYTIKKVNNSTATLEDGNGNIIRDVPCVAVLVGGEGGGGGAWGNGGPTSYSTAVARTTGPGGSWGVGATGARYGAGVAGAWAILDFSRDQFTWGQGGGPGTNTSGYARLYQIVPS